MISPTTSSNHLDTLSINDKPVDSKHDKTQPEIKKGQPDAVAADTNPAKIPMDQRDVSLKQPSVTSEMAHHSRNVDDSDLSQKVDDLVLSEQATVHKTTKKVKGAGNHRPTTPELIEFLRSNIDPYGILPEETLLETVNRQKKMVVEKFQNHIEALVDVHGKRPDTPELIQFLHEFVKSEGKGSIPSDEELTNQIHDDRFGTEKAFIAMKKGARV